MSKKRVHEIAKELKAQGIELDNKEVVNELVSLGYDVKSHSSSLEDDQANAAVLKIVSQRKPKVVAAPVAAKGFVVRRKVPGAAPLSPEPEQRNGKENEPAAMDGGARAPLEHLEETAPLSEPPRAEARPEHIPATREPAPAPERPPPVRAA